MCGLHCATSLESDLLALEATTAPASAKATTTAATTAATTATEAAAAASTATTAEATTAPASTETTTAATTTAEAAAATVVVTGLGIVQADGPTIKVTTVEGIKGSLGILNRRERHVGEALRAARLPNCTVSDMQNTP